MKRTILTAVLVMLLAFCLTACGCEHEWEEATCTAPKTCRLCSQTEGEPASHSFRSATCEVPKTCNGCGLTEGEVLPHTPGLWTTFRADYTSAKSLMVQQCQDCGTILDEKTAALDSLHDGRSFLPSAEDFAKRITVKMQELQQDYGEYTAEIIREEDDEAVLRIYCTNGRIRETVGELSFGVGGNVLNYELKDAESSYLGIGGIVSTDHLTVIMPALVRAADPAIDIPAAFALCESWIMERSTASNGILYDIMAGNESAAMFMIRVDS